MEDQVLDQAIEKKRGITIKAKSVTLHILHVMAIPTNST